MAIYPVILCGGAGTRLWPASRPARPKQFIDLVSDVSLFQETVRRVAPLAEGGRIIVVAGEAHRGFIEAQLDRTDRPGRDRSVRGLGSLHSRRGGLPGGSA